MRWSGGHSLAPAADVPSPRRPRDRQGAELGCRYFVACFPSSTYLRDLVASDRRRTLPGTSESPRSEALSEESAETSSDASHWGERLGTSCTDRASKCAAVPPALSSRAATRREQPQTRWCAQASPRGTGLA